MVEEKPEEIEVSSIQGEFNGEEQGDIRYLAGYLAGTRLAVLTLTKVLLSEPIRQGLAAGLVDHAASQSRESSPEFRRGFRESLTTLAEAPTDKNTD